MFTTWFIYLVNLIYCRWSLNIFCGKDYLLARVHIYATNTCKMRWFDPKQSFCIEATDQICIWDFFFAYSLLTIQYSLSILRALSQRKISVFSSEIYSLNWRALYWRLAHKIPKYFEKISIKLVLAIGRPVRLGIFKISSVIYGVEATFWYC